MVREIYLWKLFHLTFIMIMQHSGDIIAHFPWRSLTCEMDTNVRTWLWQKSPLRDQEIPQSIPFVKNTLCTKFPFPLFYNSVTLVKKNNFSSCVPMPHTSSPPVFTTKISKERLRLDKYANKSFLIWIEFIAGVPQQKGSPSTSNGKTSFWTKI